MKNICIYMQLPPYLRQWLVWAYGNPVRFKPRSYENQLLLHTTCRGMGTREFNRQPDNSVAIILPDNAMRRPEYYYSLTRRGRQRLAGAIDTIFKANLWHECMSSYYQGCGLNRCIDDWCQRHGISVENRDTVRKKFYRMRLDYERNGIILGKKHKKDCHTSGRFVPEF